jgi:bifunctional UDP-N-acetylglucosamine pyrophosphorylase/glucosamine-1-phosphate N-acetyltransferase
MVLNIVIMAAGKGTRMKSRRAKPLHRLAGRSLLQHVLDSASKLGAERIVAVTGYGAEQVEAAVQAPNLRFVRQMPQLGTGHAVQQAAPELLAGGTTLILNGDVPLIGSDTMRALVDASAGRRLALLTALLDDPSGYGRIVRRGERLEAIVEHKDATPEQRAIREVYTGVMAAPTAELARWLGALKNDNAQAEYYLTDVVASAVSDSVPVVAVQAASVDEILGVNSPAQLADLERRYQRAQAERLMEAGVRLADPARFDLRGELACGSDVEIDVGCVFEGCVRLGDDVTVGPHCVIRNAMIGERTTIDAYTHIDGALIGADARIGPYARLRPGAKLGDEVHIGNFVEVKNSILDRGAKANHLAYLGDAVVGERVNYGAGSITANYDGANKHRTVIGADVHVGSNCVLVAPVTIGAGATIGGGSTIAKDAPPGELTLARAPQVTIANWQRPAKKKQPD